MNAHLVGYERFALDEGTEAELAFEIDHELALLLQNNGVWDDFLTEA